MAQEPSGWETVADPSGWEPVAPPTPRVMNFAMVNGHAVNPDTGEPVDLRAMVQAGAKAGLPMKDMLPLITAAVDQQRVDRATYAPTVLGAIGGLMGGIPGAAAGGAVGAAVNQSVRRAMGAPAPETAGAQATDMAANAATQGAAQGVGTAAGAAARWLGPEIMQSAVKPGIALLKEYKTTAPAIVKTLLDEGVNVTEGGLTKLQNLLASTNDQIREAVQTATGSVSKNSVAARALQTAGKLAEQVNPEADLKAAGDVVDEFLNHPIYQGDTLSLPDAQALKVGTYQQIGKKYGQVSSAAIETQKAMARGLKEDIAAEVPQIADLNAKDAQVMAALDAVGRRVALAGNRDPIGFAWVAHNPSTFLAALMDRSPAVKSLLARGLYNGAAAISGVTPQLIRAALAALASGDPSGATDGRAPGSGGSARGPAPE